MIFKSILPKSLKRYGLLKAVNIVGESILNDRKFRIPIIRSLGYENVQMSEKWMIDLLKKIIKTHNRVFVDVGANLGQTLLKLRSVSAEMSYIGFEPNPNCVFYLRELIELNDFKHTELIPVGISNQNTILKLNYYTESASDSSASLIPNFRQKTFRSAYVPVQTFDTLLPLLESTVSILKIDVEGAELEVLQAAKVIVERDRPVILVEILPLYEPQIAERKKRQDAIEHLMKQWNYGIHKVIKTRGDKLQELRRIESIGVHSNKDECDYVMIPKEVALF